MTAIENDQGNPEGGKIQSNGDDCEQLFRNQLSNSFESFDVLYIDPTMSSSTTDACSLQHIYHDVQSSISDAENGIYHVVDKTRQERQVRGFGRGRYSSWIRQEHDLCRHQ